MANFIPQGWSITPEGARQFTNHYARIEVIVQRQVGKFHLQAMPREDLEQEGRMAAAYAMDTYVQGRGNMMGYVQTIVYNALAMVACECLAQRRTPHVEVMEQVAQYHGGRIVGIEHRWSRRPSLQMGLDVVVEDSMTCGLEGAEGAMIEREQDVVFGDGTRVSEMKLRRAMSKAPLSPDAKAMAMLMINRPPELSVLARNLTGSWGRVTHVAMGKYLGWENKRAHAAMIELTLFVKKRTQKKATELHVVSQPKRDGCPVRQKHHISAQAGSFTQTRVPR